MWQALWNLLAYSAFSLLGGFVGMLVFQLAYSAFVQIPPGFSVVDMPNGLGLSMEAFLVGMIFGPVALYLLRRRLSR